MGFELTPAILWIIIAVVFGIIEVATLGILTIWFALGALAAAVAAILGAGVPLQIILFFVISIALLYFTRPLAEKYLKIGKHKTNVESLVGPRAVVLQGFGPGQAGRARVRGQEWACEAADRKEGFAEGEEAVIVRIEGVRLLLQREEG